MSHNHIVASFGEELDQLKAEVAQLGGLAEAMVADAVAAVVTRDLDLAAQVVARDARLDELQHEIERKALRLIALRQPMAADLRRTVAAMKISFSLERVGDMAKGIAKRAPLLAEAESVTKLTRSYERMGRLVLSRLREVLDAYGRQQVDGALKVWRTDNEIDDHYDSLFRELVTYMMGDPRMISVGAHLLFMVKNLERVGDHATNVAEIVHYEITGQDIEGERPKGEPA